LSFAVAESTELDEDGNDDDDDDGGEHAEYSDCGIAAEPSCDNASSDDREKDESDDSDSLAIGCSDGSDLRAGGTSRFGVGGGGDVAGASVVVANRVPAAIVGCRWFLRAASCDSSWMNRGSILLYSARGLDLMPPPPPPHTTPVVIDELCSNSMHCRH